MSFSRDIPSKRVEAGRQPAQKLEFDTKTGKLVEVTTSPTLDNVVLTQMSAEPFFGCGFSVPVPGCLSLHDSCLERIYFAYFHISAKSNIYKPRKPCSKSANYGGLVLYACRGLQYWVTKNGTHCSTGCIVILNTDSEEVKKYQYPGQEGKVHGAIYECAFGEKMDNTVVGEGFSIQNEKLKFNSVAFNCNKPYRDRKKEMSEISQKYIKLIIESWMKAGPLSLGKLKFSVGELDKMMKKNNQENPVKREFDEMTIQQDNETPIESTKLETMSSDIQVHLSKIAKERTCNKKDQFHADTLESSKTIMKKLNAHTTVEVPLLPHTSKSHPKKMNGCFSVFDDGKDEILVRTLHISCKSDKYMPRSCWPDHIGQPRPANYTGLILYKCRGLTDWRTRNGMHCRSGYVLISKIETVNKEYQEEEGKSYEAVYESTFGEKMDSGVVGEGFKIQNEVLKFNPFPFNYSAPYHDNNKKISDITKHYICLVVQSWMKAGPSSLGPRNFHISELDLLW